LLGDERTLELSDAGRMVEKQWLDLPVRFPFCELGDWVVMPNHFHGVLVFHDASHEEELEPATLGGTTEGSLGRVMQAFKSITTDRYIKGVHEKSWPPFEKKLWLRGYWDRIIRNEVEWTRANDYIFNNPAQWECDKRHPEENARLRAKASIL
jgi:putative transposase